MPENTITSLRALREVRCPLTGAGTGVSAEAMLNYLKEHGYPELTLSTLCAWEKGREGGGRDPKPQFKRDYANALEAILEARRESVITNRCLSGIAPEAT